MAKFILSNKENIVEKIVADSCSVGFKVSGSYKVSAFYNCFYKLSNPNCNFLTIVDDFVSVTGTCIYKGVHGEDALKAIYSDFKSNMDINSIRDEVIGNCAFIIKKDDKIFVFGEYNAFYDIYFYSKNGLWIVAHDLYDVYKSIKDLNINKLNMLEHLSLGCNYCGETIFDDVYRLQDNESLTINLLDGSITKYVFNVEWKGKEKLTYEESVSKISSTLKSISKTFYDNFGIPALSSTGGLDNRLNLAMFLANGIKPDLYYGIGNSGATNTFPGDLMVNKEIEKNFGTKLHQVSWNNSNPIDRDWEELKNKYGFSSVCYAGAKDFFEAYENIPNSSLLFGYMGELYRNLDVWEVRKFKSMTLGEYIDEYLIKSFINSKTKLFDDIDKIKQHLYRQLEKVCKKWNININSISSEDEFFLNLERRRCADVVIVNLVNYHHYCSYLIGNHQVLSFVAPILAKSKLKCKFQLDILKELYPQVLHIPFFSHCRMRVYEPKTNTLREKKTFLQILKQCIPRQCRTIVKDNIPKVLRPSKEAKKMNEDLFDQGTYLALQKIFKEHNLLEGKDYNAWIDGRLDRLFMSYAQELFLFSK